MNLKEQWDSTPLWQKVLIVVLFSFLLSYGVYYTIIGPQMEEINKLESEISELKVELEGMQLKNLKKVQNKLAELKKKNQELEGKVVEYERLVGDYPDVNKVLELVNSLAKQGITPIGFFPQEKKEVLLFYDTKDGKVYMKDAEDKKNKSKTSTGKDKDANQPENPDAKFGMLNIAVPVVADYKSLKRVVMQLNVSKSPIRLNAIYLYRKFYYNKNDKVEEFWSVTIEKSVEKYINSEEKSLITSITSKDNNKDNNKEKKEKYEEKDNNGNNQEKSKTEYSEKKEVKIGYSDEKYTFKIKGFDSEDSRILGNLVDKYTTVEKERKDEIKNNLNYCVNKLFLDNKICVTLIFTVFYKGEKQ